MCVFVWHPEPCCIYLTYSCKIKTISRLIFLCLLHSQTEFVCTKVVCKFLITPYQFYNQLGFLVNLLFKVMAAAVNVTSIGFQFFLDLRILWTLKSFLALVFAEANLLVVSDFPEHMGNLRFEKPVGVEIPSILSQVFWTLAWSISRWWRHQVASFQDANNSLLVSYILNLNGKAQFLERLFLDFSAFKNFNFQSNHFHFFR